MVTTSSAPSGIGPSGRDWLRIVRLCSSFSASDYPVGCSESIYSGRVAPVFGDGVSTLRLMLLFWFSFSTSIPRTMPRTQERLAKKPINLVSEKTKRELLFISKFWSLDNVVT